MGDVYRHFKGSEYLVLVSGKHTTCQTPLVVYFNRKDKGKPLPEVTIWIRPLSEWHEAVDRDGYQGPRFTYVGRDEDLDEAG